MRLISPPIGLAHLHWFNLVLAFWALRPNENKLNAKLMYLFGFSLIASNYYWIAEPAISIGGIPGPFAWMVVVLYAGFFALPFAVLGWATHWLRDRFGIGWVWLLPGLQVALEQVWPALFPYYHGALFYKSPLPWQLASVFGVTSLSYLAFLTNTALSELLYRKATPTKGNVKTLAMVPVLFVSVFVFGYFRHAAIEKQLQEAPIIRASILQLTQSMKYRLDRDTWENVRDWYSVTKKILDKKPDLVVWPEGAQGGPFNPIEKEPCKFYPPYGVKKKACSVLADKEDLTLADEQKSMYDFYSDLAKEHNFHFLVGGGSSDHSFISFLKDPANREKISTAESLLHALRTEFVFTNSCYLFDPEGGVSDPYHKMILLPFGEYVPGSDLFPALKGIIPGAGNFQGGENVEYFSAKINDVNYKFSTPICYEAILDRQMRKMIDTDIFVNITNDAWFGDSAAPHQHAMLAAVQPIQWGRPMLRSAYTGVSMIIEPHGDVLYETKPFVETAEVVDMRVKTIDTIYRKGGWIFPWLWVSFWAIFFILIRLQKNKNNIE